MKTSGEVMPDVLEYFHALHTEIIKGQKLRVQVFLEADNETVIRWTARARQGPITRSRPA
jgi:hypothetical protein